VEDRIQSQYLCDVCGGPSGTKTVSSLNMSIPTFVINLISQILHIHSPIILETDCGPAINYSLTYVDSNSTKSKTKLIQLNNQFFILVKRTCL